MLCALIKNGVVEDIQDLTEQQIQETAADYELVMDISLLSPAPGIGWIFDGVGALSPPGGGTPSSPIPLPVKITKLAFRQRLTMAELVGLQVAAAQQTQIGFTLQVMQANLAVATYIDLTRADTISGVGLLVSLGLLSQARATAILTTPPTEIELYKG